MSGEAGAVDLRVNSSGNRNATGTECGRRRYRWFSLIRWRCSGYCYPLDADGNLSVSNLTEYELTALMPPDEVGVVVGARDGTIFALTEWSASIQPTSH